MILFTILMTILLGVAFIALFTLAVGGSVLAVVFGDLIICVLMIVIIVKLIKQIRKK